MRALHFLPVILVLLLSPMVKAQDPGGTDEQLAAQYFQNADFDRAVLYYEKLYKKQPTAYYYEQLLKCYTSLKRYEEAEKLVKDQDRKQDDARYPIDLGYIYKLMGDDDKARQQYEKALKAMKADQGSIRQTANAFTRVNELDMALEAYTRGQRMVKDDTSFGFEVANLLAAKGDVPGMVKSYFDLLEVNEGYIQATQNSLSRYIDFSKDDERTELVRTELLRRIQHSPDKTIFPELLIWVYIQQKDLSSAFLQSKAMDKRFNEGGKRMMELAEIAVTNKDWSTAAKCYDYVIAMGGENPNYINARLGLVKSMTAQVTAQADPPREELDKLLLQYETTLTDLGRVNSTVDLMRDEARLKAYYLNDRPGGISILEEAIAMPTLDPRKQGELKLELGDVHVLDANIWDASLLYSQVDLDFKYDVLGNEARLRNAKVSFYAGDFLWAQAQLDVLKASTSKLIANDAMELSLLIGDNLGADSNMVPLSMFARAQLLTFQHRYAEATITLDSLDNAFPMHSLGDDVLYERYRIAFAKHQYAEAAGYLDKVIELYPIDILVDNALFDLGKLYEDQIGDKEKAKSYFEKLLFEQSGSIFVPDAREHFRRLRGDHDNLDTPEQKFLNGQAP